ncbi:hypothetical protein [Methylobacterium trifolii]|uniref:Uncharacterized protein n=1 Tax=Methylobacterium trifolii TaxID=1003092 RepID=A0ABQ4U0J4_9HYPH|nr:hypothetical protein [Methylobacterium trifolii]GJE60513.1 hypothetical protein MPOCJGCO_2625 [Methylobacterium trifolii]
MFDANPELHILAGALGDQLSALHRLLNAADVFDSQLGDEVYGMLTLAGMGAHQLAVRLDPAFVTIAPRPKDRAHAPSV